MKSKSIYSVILAMTLGTVSGVGVSTISSPKALAKTKLARVISYKRLNKTPYNVNKGYLYTNPRLNKKAHKAANYLSWTFYATESAKVKKTNGKAAVYYYLKSGNSKIKGWICAGNLSKKNTFKTQGTFSRQSPNKYYQQRSDINSMKAIVKIMDENDRDYVLSDFNYITPQNAYSSNGEGLSGVVEDMGESAYYPENFDKTSLIMNGKAISSAYQLFNNRFDPMTNRKLMILAMHLDDDINYKYYDGISNASLSLANALSLAITTLQNN